MKPYLAPILLAVLPAFLAAQNRPPEIEERILRTNRHAIYDPDKDGWCNLWVSLYRYSPDGRNFIDHIKNDPDGDADGDGVSNFDEMLNFSNPYAADVPPRPRTPEEIRASRIAALETARASDEEKTGRFHAILRQRGVLVENTTQPQEPVAPPPPEREGEVKGLGQEEDENGADQSFHAPATGGLFLCNTAGQEDACIIALERLSTGRFLLAWEGPPDQLYSIQYSDDLVTWHPGASALPAVGGIGTWGQTSTSPNRFFRVIQQYSVAQGLSSTTPSHPSGGDGITTFGGTLSYDPVTSMMTAHANLPGGIKPSLVALHIDGEFYGYFHEGENDDYRLWVDRIRISGGNRTAYALIHAMFETTPEPGVPVPVSPGILRSPEILFVNPRTGPNRLAMTGIRATETDIHTGEPGSPELTTFIMEFPDFTGPGNSYYEFDYTFTLRDEDNNIVREWEGTYTASGPGQIEIDWDGTSEGGSTLPFGTYYGTFTQQMQGMIQSPSIPVRNGAAPFRALTLYETLGAQANWGHVERAKYSPEWADDIVTYNHWGPWETLGSPLTVAGILTDGLKDYQNSKWVATYWGPGNDNNTAQPWKNAKTRPANDFLTGNPFNGYDMGFLVGHGIASKGGTYTNANDVEVTLPPQHYFPMVANNMTGETVWLKSGQMAENFGHGGRLKWMFMITCNYLRVADHQPPPAFKSDEIYQPMKAAGTLPFGEGLHILCGYTTKIEIEAALAKALADALVQHVHDQGTVVKAWNYAWHESTNRTQGFNARSVFWPECENDTIHGVPNESVATLNAHASQAELDQKDSELIQ